MKEFLEALEENEELKAKVEELCKDKDSGSKEIIALAKEYGFTLTEDDFTITQNPNGEISDDELDAVTGGKHDGIADCMCGGGGYGGATYKSDVCVCAITGFGFYTWGDLMCYCVLVAYG